MTQNSLNKLAEVVLPTAAVQLPKSQSKPYLQIADNLLSVVHSMPKLTQTNSLRLSDPETEVPHTELKLTKALI